MIDIVTQLKDDHRKVEDLFQKFEDSSGKRDKQRVAEPIIEELSLHPSIEEEESELPTRLEGITSEEDRARFAATRPRPKELVPNHPHPMAPDTPPKNLFGGLLAKVLDTTKDLARLVTAPEKRRARMAAKNSRRGDTEKPPPVAENAGRRSRIRTPR